VTEQGDEVRAPALDAARQRRIELHDALVAAEEAISRPAPGREADWAGDVTKAMLRLRDSFDEHIRVAEEAEGLYDEILERAPHLAGKVARLKDEHPRIRADAGVEIDRLDAASAAGNDRDVDEVRDDLQRFLGKVVRHRQHGADLVWEAYNLDIGGMG
jgi:hypothetical protein